MKRTEGRGAGALRPVRIARNYLKHAEGYVLIEMVDTKVICSASVEENVPPFLRNSGKGWITAEYFMLPRSTHTRTSRDSVTSRSNGRALEIQRLIGRSLRSVVDLEGFGERTIWVDCDGIQADGGARTASITGASVALVDAFRKMVKDEVIDRIPIEDYEAAVSVGKASGNVLLDLNYEEDSSHLKASDKHFCWMAVNTPWTAPVYETAFRKNTLKASQFHLTLSLTLDIL